MRLTELAELLEQTNIPVAYSHFKDAQTLPFICYVDTGSNNLMADNKVYKKFETVDIELYTQTKDIELEERLEEILDNNEVPYNNSGTFFIESEDMFLTTYTIKLFRSDKLNGK